MHLFKESVEFNLDQLLGSFKSRLITGSAFSQARYKIKPVFFSDLNDQLKTGYDQSNKQLWKGHLLIAGDGSSVNLPPSKSIEAYFGVHSATNQGTKSYLARTLLLYDVLNNYVLDAHLSKWEEGEIKLLRRAFVNDFPLNSLFLLDRGFGYYNVLLELLTKQRDFCVRLRPSSSFFKKMLNQKGNDIIALWHPSLREKKSSQTNGLEPAPIEVRIVKVELKTGEIELLATSLSDWEKYSYEDIAELYQYRWGVEEGFKNLKPKMKLEQFGTRKPEGVFQEFFAHIFCMNMISLFGQQADKAIRKKTAHRKYIYRYNWKNAFRIIRKHIVEWIKCIDPEDLIDKIIAAIERTMISVRPDRTFVRDPRNLNRKLRITQFNK